MANATEAWCSRLATRRTELVWSSKASKQGSCTSGAHATGSSLLPVSWYCTCGCSSAVSSSKARPRPRSNAGCSRTSPLDFTTSTFGPNCGGVGAGGCFEQGGTQRDLVWRPVRAAAAPAVATSARDGSYARRPAATVLPPPMRLAPRPDPASSAALLTLTCRISLMRAPVFMKERLGRSTSPPWYERAG